jgi:hypothetical protein
MLITPTVKPPLHKTPMAAIGDHYEDLLRFSKVIYFPALKSVIDRNQSIMAMRCQRSPPQRYHGLWVQLLTFSRNENNRKKNNG